MSTRHIRLDIRLTQEIRITHLPKISSNSPTPLKDSVSYINLEEINTYQLNSVIVSKKPQTN